MKGQVGRPGKDERAIEYDSDFIRGRSSRGIRTPLRDAAWPTCCDSLKRFEFFFHFWGTHAPMAPTADPLTPKQEREMKEDREHKERERNLEFVSQEGTSSTNMGSSKRKSITRANTILGQVSSNGRRTRRRVPPGGATGWMSPLSCRGLSGTQAAVTRRPQRKRGISTRRGVLGQGHRMAALHPGAADFDPGSVQSRWMASSASCTDPTSVLNGLGPQR